MGCQMSVKKIIALSLIVTFASAITAGAAENWEQYKDQVRIKKAIAAQLTPEQYQARVEKLAKMLAARANAPKSARPNAPLTSGDTCPSATFSASLAVQQFQYNSRTGRRLQTTAGYDGSNVHCINNLHWHGGGSVIAAWIDLHRYRHRPGSRLPNPYQRELHPERGDDADRRPGPRADNLPVAVFKQFGGL